MTLIFDGVLQISSYTFMHNFMKLSAAVHMSCRVHSFSTTKKTTLPSFCMGSNKRINKKMEK